MEHQFKPFDKIIVRDSEEETWMCDFFSHYEKDVAYKYVGISDAHRDCLPYEGNEHLVGTYNGPTPPEPEFKFGDKVEVERPGYHGWFKAVFLYMNKSMSSKDKKYYKVYSKLHGEINVEKIRHADWED